MQHEIDYMTPSLLEAELEKTKKAETMEEKEQEEFSSKKEMSSTYFEEIVPPSELTDEIKDEIITLIDQFGRFRKKEGEQIGPTIGERIDDFDYVAYILNEKNIPVAVGAISDPTKEDWTGHIKRDYFEKKSAKNLADRKEREMVSINPEYKGLGLTERIENLLKSQEPRLYALARVGDAEAEASLIKLGYVLISKFPSDYSEYELGLWISK